MRTLILGATGQIGEQLVTACERRDHTVFGTWYRQPHPDYRPLDVCDRDAVAELVRDVQPDVVLMAAGISRIDFCEAFPHECRAVNAVGPAVMADVLADTPTRLVFVSTSQVFGDVARPQSETAPTNPLNEYGRAAVAAEHAIRDRLPDRHLIVRTGFVYGPESRGRNPALSLQKKLAEGRRVTVAADRTVQPTYGPDLAEAVVDLVERGERGTIHAVGPDRMSEATFASTLAFIHGYDCDAIVGVKADCLREDAPRPRTGGLERLLVRGLLGPKAFRTVGEGLRHLRGIPARTAVAA